MMELNHTRYFLLLVGILFFKLAAAQNDSVKNDTNALAADSRIQMHQLKKFTYVFTDSTNALTIQQVASPIFVNRFISLPDSMEALPEYSYWLKFSIKAIGDIDNWWILNNTSSHGYVDAWIIDESNQVISHHGTGVFVARSQKSVKEHTVLNRFLFSAKNGERRTVYLKISDEYAAEEITSFELRDPEIGISWETSYLMSVISGSVFVFSILSFFFYFFIKEKAYLFFGLYTLTVCLHYLILHPDLPFVNWFIPEHPRLAMPAFYLLAISGWIFFVLFGKFLIDLPTLSKRLNTILKWSIGIWVVVLLTTVTAMAVTGRIILMELNIAFGILFIVYLVRISFFKSVLVRFYVFGALWLVVFSALGVLGVSFTYINPFPIGQLGQILIYAAGLAYKMKMNEKARAEAQIVKIRNAELSKALEDLKAAQTQLIQSEKMASLGELTAGIAHEIQNPLNFVNNFSEVNKEMLAEMREEIKRKNFDDVSSIAKNVEENEEKIIFHGKRADAIVKGMLQHSRSSSGVKELTDINALADEYLRLAYHGLRAKDKLFNAILKTDYDASIGKIDIIPQDIGRAILNLITNAFYAASLPPPERIGINSGGFKDPNYKHVPTVWLSTKKIGDKVLISVRDNGPGIPQKVLDKIFQPFFTTKPTGQGTGLGLSLSYDIIKAHGGEIKLETREGEGTEFIIQLPLSQ